MNSFASTNKLKIKKTVKTSFDSVYSYQKYEYQIQTISIVSNLIIKPRALQPQK